jgi:hypothetical protein
LILHRFTGWNKLKSSKIIKLLETFWYNITHFNNT